MQWPSVEELNAMTLQVGLVGNDGIVLASDRLFQSYEYQARSVSRGSKFLSGAGVICCCSGDSLAEQSAYGVRDYDWTAVVSSDVEANQSALRQIGNTAFRNMQTQFGTVRNVVSKVLVVLHEDQLWLLDATVHNGCTARLVPDRQVTGDIGNTCRYFMNKYANFSNLRPVSELISLAAYTILAAGEENPYGVGGLEIYVIPTHKPPILLSAAQEQELEIWFKEAAESIRDRLLHPFDYAGANANHNL
jgi:hypothetical protein